MQTVPHTSDDVKIFTHALSQFMAIGKNLTLTQEKIRQHLVKTSSAVQSQSQFLSTFQSNLSAVNSELSHFNVLYAHTLALLRQNASLQSTIAQLKNIKLEIAETIGINKNWLPPLADINSIFRALHKELTLNTFCLKSANVCA